MEKRYYLMVIGADDDWVVGVRGLLFDNHARRLYFKERYFVAQFIKTHITNMRLLVRGRSMILIDDQLGKVEQVHLR